MSWIKIALRPDVVSRSLKVGLIVGTILVTINQGNIIFSGQWMTELFWKIPLTYLVPYSVSTYASVSAIRAQEKNR